MNKSVFAIALLACAATAQATHGGLHGIRDSTGVTNDGWATLSWQDSGWTRCNAASQGCGSTTGYKTQRITCSATELDGTVSTVSEHLCLNVVSSIGSKPRDSQACTINWGRCVPAAPPKPPKSTTAGIGGTSTGGIGYCGASVAVCQAYDNTFGRAPEGGPGPAFWDGYVRDTGNKPGSDKFQEAFENGARGADCYKVPGTKSSFCKLK